MSLNPVYLWNPQNFPAPQAMLPDGFDAAHRIVSEWADQTPAARRGHQRV